MKKLLLIATGGTIASVPGKRGLSPGLATAELESFISSKNQSYTIKSVDLMNIDSTNMQPEDWIKIASAVYDSYDDFDGFIITHGTDTMAFTSAALSYMLENLSKAVVITGSQVPFYDGKTDAKKNLVDAVRFACEPVAGVFVVFDGKAIAGTRAVKIRTKSMDAFESINYPYIAKIDRGDVHYCMKIASPVDQKLKLHTSMCEDVFLLKLHPGTKPEVFDYLRLLYKGIVIESFGNGGIPFLHRNLLPKIEQIVEAGIAVVVTTQCLQEGEDLSLYEVGRRVAENDKIILSKDMNTEAIIPKLMWALGMTADVFEVKGIMERPIAHDCSY